MANKKGGKDKVLTISLKGVSAEFHAKFHELCKSNNLTQVEAAKVLLQNYLYCSLDFTKEDTKIIDSALVIAPKTYNKKIKKAVLRCANSIVDSNTGDGTTDITTPKSGHAADRRADVLLDLIFKDNETAPNWYDKKFITGTSFLKYALRLKDISDVAVTTSKAVIDRCLERRSALIASHHSEHGLNDTHNLKAHYEILKLANLDVSDKIKEV